MKAVITNIKLQNLKRYLSLGLMLLTLSAVTAGCSSKSSSSGSNANRGRSGAYQDVITSPQTGQALSNSDWGTISNSSGYSSNLQSFIYNVTDLGFVSGNLYDSTGIRFRGSVAKKVIQFLVWDEKVNSQGLLPYTWNFAVRESQQNGNRVTVFLEDAVGDVTLDGYVQNGIWSGTVTFVNSQTNGYSGTLGTFAIATNSIK